MKQPRTIRIINLLTSVVTSVLHGEKLVLDQNSAKLEELGGIYIKFLQLIVLNLDPNNQASYKQLLSVYENSQPDAIDIRRYLARELPAGSLDQFKAIDSQPFATGSFGQVYKATLWDNHQVIIKVLRPSVVRYLGYDLRLIGILSWLYSMFDRQKMLNFRSMYKDFKRTSLAETDYIREAAVAQAYFEDYKSHPYLIIPQTYSQLSNRHVITQDFVEGLSISSLLALQSNGNNAADYCRDHLGSNLSFQLKVVGVELFNKALVGEIVQTDPHPGNIILLPNNQVALIDFGMSTIVRQNRQALYELVVQYQAFYSGKLNIEEFTLSALKCLAPELYAAIAKTETVLEQEGMQINMFDRLREAVNEIFDDFETRPFIDQLIERRQIMKVLFFAINKGNRFGFNFDLSATSLWKAVQTYFVLVHRFDQQGEDQSVDIVLSVLNEVMWFAQSNLDRIIESPRAEISPTEALETLSCWFDKMARNDPWLMVKLTKDYIR